MPAARELHRRDVRACFACGGDDFTRLLSTADVRAEQRWLADFQDDRIRKRSAGAQAGKDRASFTQSEPTGVVRCRGCGTVYRDPQPSCAALKATYAADAYGEDALRRLAANQARFFRAALARLGEGGALDGLGRGARVLEVGCFVGGFLGAARARGWRAVGLDVGEETSAFCRRAGFEVVRGDVSRAPWPPGSQDAIFVWNTFDQLCNPGESLRGAHRLLRGAGPLVLRVPNGRFESACLELRHRFGTGSRARRVVVAQAYNNFIGFPYLTGYTPESLGRLLAAHGFAVAAVHGGTIVASAGPDTEPWAVREESRYRRAVQRTCDLVARETGARLHPWIDVVAFRRPL